MIIYKSSRNDGFSGAIDFLKICLLLGISINSRDRQNLNSLTCIHAFNNLASVRTTVCGNNLFGTHTVYKVRYLPFVHVNTSSDSFLPDIFDGGDALSHISASLKGKDPEKVRRFVAMVSAMADKIDEI